MVYVPNEGEDDYTLSDFALEEDNYSDTASLMLGVNYQLHVNERRNGKNG